MTRRKWRFGVAVGAAVVVVDAVTKAAVRFVAVSSIAVAASATALVAAVAFGVA
jgi:hypothetical protein